jgi:predicted nucleotidyltransferase component of viral defense system
MLDLSALQREAAATGFRTESLEKVIRLLDVLEGIRSHPFLKSRLALKGGTALNLFVLDVPRLSVDIDLNYIGTAEREPMLAERPQVELALQAVCGRLGLQTRRVPGEHAGGKWQLTYMGVDGRPGTLEVDVNFLLRTPLWPPGSADSRRIGSFGVSGVPMLNLHELVAGKLAALFGRSASRDLFDVRGLLAAGPFDTERLRLGFVSYGGMSRRDWREVSLDEVQADLHDVGQRLLPLLRAGAGPARTDLVVWSAALASESRELLSAVLPLRAEEVAFLGLLNERGEIRPDLLTGDAAMQALLRAHPGLRWKALNVRRHRGIDGGDGGVRGNVD